MGRRRNWRLTAVGLAFAFSGAAPAGAHPHVWVTVKSEIAFHARRERFPP